MPPADNQRPTPVSSAARRRRVFVGILWVAIAIKVALVLWATHRYSIGIHPAWVIAPTLALALLASFCLLRVRQD